MERDDGRGRARLGSCQRTDHGVEWQQCRCMTTACRSNRQKQFQRRPNTARQACLVGQQGPHRRSAFTQYRWRHAEDEIRDRSGHRSPDDTGAHLVGVSRDPTIVEQQVDGNAATAKWAVCRYGRVGMGKPPDKRIGARALQQLTVVQAGGSHDAAIEGAGGSSVEGTGGSSANIFKVSRSADSSTSRVMNTMRVR